MSSIGTKAFNKIFVGNKEVQSIFIGDNKVYEAKYPIYGVEWADDASTTMTRTDDAINLSYTINSSNGTIASDFDNVFPWNETEIITDTAGNKFLHFPDMWFRIIYNSSSSYKILTGVAVSKKPNEIGNWYLCKSFDYGIYGGSVDVNNKLCSVSGVARLANTTRADVRTYSSANTENNYTYHQIDIKHKVVLMFLWWIEFATKNSANIMTGVVNAQSAENAGGTDNLTTPSGWNISTNQMRYHYIEDFIGNLLEYIDGVNYGYYIGTSKRLRTRVTNNPLIFDDLNTGLGGYVSQDWYPPRNTGVVETWGWEDDMPFCITPSYMRATSSTVTYDTRFGDYTYNGNENRPIYVNGACFKVPLVYPTFDNPDLQGLCFNVGLPISATPSQTQDYIGGRLMRQITDSWL